MPANPLQNLDPATVGSIIGSMIPAALIGAGWLIRVIVKNRRAAARMVVAALDDSPKTGDNPHQETPVNAAILQYLHNQEARDIADRQERSRQWERVESLTLQLKDQASALQGLLTAVQNSALFANHAHEHHARQIDGIAQNQILLSNWLRDNYPRPSVQGQGFAYPPFQQPPPLSRDGR